MGDNLYTAYWQSVLPNLIEQFKEGKPIVQLQVKELENIRQRESYYTNFRIERGVLEKRNAAQAYGRDLFDVLSDSDYFKEHLEDSILQVNINNLLLKIEILAPDAPDFYTAEDFTELAKFTGQTMDNGNEEHRKTYDFLKNTYTKTEYWTKQVNQKLFPNGIIQIRKRPTNQASKFEYYQWAKIYPDKATADYSALAFTLGLDTENQFVVKIDTIGLGMPENDERRKKYLEIRGDYKNSKIVKILPYQQVLDKGWQYLIDLSAHLITELKPDFDSILLVLKGAPGTVTIAPTVDKKEIKMELNTILYGPPGTGKTYKLQFLRKDFIITKSVQTREDFLEGLIPKLTWWETIAAALMDVKTASVPELEKHEFIKIKARQSTSVNVKQIIWGSLQSRTDLACENVKFADRREPYIFWKEENSIWKILEDRVKDECPEIMEFLKVVRDFKPHSGTVQKNFKMVTFHQNFSYEDFVEGIKPVFNVFETEKLQYEIQKGIFYQCCNEAAKLAGYDNLHDCITDAKENRAAKIKAATPYALFIDEVNRANVSSVLGELITLLEDDKRLGAENEIINITLPYSKSLFGVPANLYIIGTMNTADRSVEALDTALRRRFTFELMEPDSSKITESPEGVDLIKLLDTINGRLETLLSKDHTIGHAWLMKIDTLEKLKAAFKNKILPLLQEFFYNDYAKIGLVLGKAFVTGEKAGNQFAKFDNELAGEYEDKLIYTLKDCSKLTIEDFKSVYE